MQDTLDIIKNIEMVYDNNTSFQVLKDFERVLDDLDLYVYANWEDGELAAGPEISRHWVSCTFMWERDKMPDPMGGKRLLDYDCRVTYKKDELIVPRTIREPNDVRPGTQKGKLDRKPIWLVTIEMPTSLIADIYAGYSEANIHKLEAELPQETDQLNQEADQLADAGTDTEIGAAPEQSADEGVTV